MKLAFFDDFKLGLVAGDSVVDVTDVVKDISRLGPQDVMRGVIELRSASACSWGTSRDVSEPANRVRSH
jgi:hypothetical protein